MKTVTIEQFLTFAPCYGKDKIHRIAGDKTEWTALDVLALENVPIGDRLWAVLREEFIPAEILHEFACRCAEHALERVENPDPRSVEAIAAKRAWLRGEITDEQLAAAREVAGAASGAASWTAAGDAAGTAAGDAAGTAAGDAAWTASGAAAWTAAGATSGAAAGAASGDAAWTAKRQWQLATLREMLCAA